MQKDSALPLCTVLYLAFPLLFFVIGWLKSPLSIILLIFLILLILFIMKDLFLCLRAEPLLSLNSNLPSDPPGKIPQIVAFVIIMLWVFLSGAGGFGFQCDDYRASNALLKDLIEQPWPLTVQWNGTTAPVVYYVGWYLPAALAGKMLGWSAGNIVSFGGTFIGTFLSFLWFLRVASIRNLNVIKALIVLAVFCLADGLDFLILNTGWDFLQYSAQTTLLFWVPQHAIPAWLIAGLVADYVRGHLSTVKYLGISIAACVICSPFGIIGIVPYILAVLFMSWQRQQWRVLFSLQSVVFNLGALPYAVVGILYLSSNQFSFPKGFLWEFTDSPLIFLAWLEFCLIEFGVIAMIVFIGLWLDSSAYRRAYPSGRKTYQDYLKDVHGIDNASFMLFGISILVLLFLPFYRMGYNDDLVMRGSIPALFIFWAFISRILADSGYSRNSKLRLLCLTIACLTITGFYISLSQIWNSVTRYRFGPPDPNSVLTTVNVNSPSIVGQRLGRADTFFYKNLGK